MAVAPDPLMIAYDGEKALGVAIAIAQEMETWLAEQPDAPPAPTVVVPTPTPRASIAARVEDGESDFTTLVVSRTDRLDLTPTTPLIRKVHDVAVIGPDVAPVTTLDDLEGVPIYVVEGGRYVAHLAALNARRQADGKEPLIVKLVDPRLSDHDLIELVQVGVIPATVTDDFKAEFWQTIYTDVTIAADAPLTEDVRIGWAVRSENPKLLAALNGFAETIKQGTLIGNVVLSQYADDATWVENLGTNDARTRIAEVAPVIERYAQQFGFESDLVLSQAYQESKLDQSRRSHVGAIGVMQVMPATAADPVVDIPDVTTLDNNVKAGIKYLRWLRDTYFDDPQITPLDQTLLAFAAYNAGPGGVQRAQERAVEMGLDPNVWFENVELAIQQAVSREPAVYVRNIFKYYVSYRLLQEIEDDTTETLTPVAELEDKISDLPLEERAEVLETETDIVVGDGPDGTETVASNASGTDR